VVVDKQRLKVDGWKKELKTAEVLSPFKEEYITRRYLDWFFDPEVTKYTSHRGMTEGRAREYVRSLGGTSFAWSIFADYDGKDNTGIHIGNVALQSIDDRARTGEFAIIIGDKDYWGKKVGSSCMGFILETAFERYGLLKVWLGTAKENIGMRKIAEHWGFEHEGTFKNHLFCNGKLTDAVFYGRFKNRE
jgi:ribosomal-protein-alanine N-acetyltransferase